MAKVHPGSPKSQPWDVCTSASSPHMEAQRGPETTQLTPATCPTPGARVKVTSSSLAPVSLTQCLPHLTHPPAPQNH